MMNIILSQFTENYLPIIILVIVILISILLYKLMRKKFNNNYKPGNIKNDTPEIKQKSHYCTEQEMRFLEALHKALPRDCISFPHVGLTKIIEPKNNKLDYNEMTDKFVDVCVFLRKDMQPILVIDLYENSPAAQQLKKFPDNVSKILKTAKIPVLHKSIDKKYDISSLRKEVLESMNNTIVAYLKDKFIRDNDK